MRAVFEKLTPVQGHLFFCQERKAPRFEFLWHHHREFELTLIVKGQGRRFVGDNIEDYGPGDLVLFGPDLPHTYASEDRRDANDNHEAVVIQFSGDVFAGRGIEQLPPGGPRSLLEASSLGVRFSEAKSAALMPEIRQMCNQPPVRQLASLLVVLDALSDDPQCKTLSTKMLPGPRSSAEPQSPQSETPNQTPVAGEQAIDRVGRFVNAGYLEKITLQDAADVAGMSESAFCRFFKRTTGKTLVNYVNELRVGHACRLLVDSDRSVAEIAHASGFANLSHFNQRFLQLKGLRPTAFRKAYRQGV